VRLGLRYLRFSIALPVAGGAAQRGLKIHTHRLGREAQAFVDRISRFAQENGVISDVNKFKSTLLQRLSITLQKHNSKITRRWLVDERWRAKKTRAMRELARAAAKPPTQTE